MEETLLSDLDSYAHELDEMLSDKRIDELKNGKLEVYSLKEVAKELSLNYNT